MRGPAMALVAALGTLACAASAADERAAAVAGSFYPAEPKALRAAIEAFLADSVPAGGERPLALVAPHAGYVYSGQIAADAYRQVLGHPIDVVVILGTNHRAAPFVGISIDPSAGFRTPLGVAAADRELVAALGAASKEVTYVAAAHAGEHSTEVQLPFIQVALPQAKVVVAVVGSSDLGLAQRFGATLAKTLAGRQALIVASSDLSHYPSRDEAGEVDRATLAAIAALDPAAVRRATSRAEREFRPGLATCACGEGPILVAMAAAQALGARRGVVLSYANSGETVAGEADRVVGYGAVAFTAGSGPADTSALTLPAPAAAEAPLTAADRAALLTLARTTLERFFSTGTFPLPRPTSPVLRRRQGAFVTWRKHGDLRGCIGHMAEDTPLSLTVARMAHAAALRDPRFPPVRAEELAALELEVSVLTPFRSIPGPAAIVVGRDGVLLEKAGRRAVFLPQVATEEGWDRETMLGQLCQKAGLEADCWRLGATFWSFQADVFGEAKAP